jgi:hypothetical protein
MDNKLIMKIIGINLLVMLLYAALIAVWAEWQYHDPMGYAFMLMFALGIHALVAISMSVVMFVQNKTERGIRFLIAFLAVLIIGPFACFGGADLFF